MDGLYKGFRAGDVVRVDFIAVVVAQFRLPISEQVAKIHRRFAVHSCDLRPFLAVAML